MLHHADPGHPVTQLVYAGVANRLADGFLIEHAGQLLGYGFDDQQAQTAMLKGRDAIDNLAQLLARDL